MDIFGKKKRTEIMSSVRSKNNKSTELKLIKIFKVYNIKGWQINYKIIGKQDFVFQKTKQRYLSMVAFGMGIIAEM